MLESLLWVIRVCAVFGVHMCIKQVIAVLQWRKPKCRQNWINFPQSDNESVTELMKETTSPDEAERAKLWLGTFTDTTPNSTQMEMTSVWRWSPLLSSVLSWESLVGQKLLLSQIWSLLLALGPVHWDPRVVESHPCISCAAPECARDGGRRGGMDEGGVPRTSLLLPEGGHCHVQHTENPLTAL